MFRHVVVYKLGCRQQIAITSFPAPTSCGQEQRKMISWIKVKLIC